MNVTDAGLVTRLKSTMVKMNNNTEGSLMDMVLTTGGVLMAMALLSCFCCICIKLSDLRLRACVIETAKKKGLQVDLEKLDSKHGCDSPHANENCTIMVPEVGYIL